MTIPSLEKNSFLRAQNHASRIEFGVPGNTLENLKIQNEWRQRAEEIGEKTRAKQKIEELKEQLRFLERGGFDPKVLARLAKQLSHAAGMAMQNFASATGNFAGVGMPASSQAAALAPPIDATAPAESTNEDAGDSSVNAVVAAYREQSDQPSSSDDDHEILEELQAIKNRAAAIEKKAAEESQTETVYTSDDPGNMSTASGPIFV